MQTHKVQTTIGDVYHQKVVTLASKKGISPSSMYRRAIEEFIEDKYALILEKLQ
jgi:hypothetical protein|tara:strand:- start:50 stop:211 length:162 start_codon:yes stop_codon:yes gene_type:complete